MTLQVAIVALPPVSMSGIAPIVDTLSLANEIDGHRLYEWRICSWDGRPVPLSGGAQLPADCAFNDAVRCDWLIVVSGAISSSRTTGSFSRVSRAWRRARRSCPAFIMACGGSRWPGNSRNIASP